MAVPPPVLDTRVLQDVLLQLQQQAGADLPEWKPSPQGDVGTMLQRIFARFMELAIQRLNQAPEKNFFAFLDAMGVTLQPPSPSQVPLVFGLSAGRGPTVVPAGTQAGTKPGGQFPALMFETTEDYTVLPAKLASAHTVDPVWDRRTDQTAAITGGTSLAFTPFVGTTRLPHAIYFGDDLLLNFAQAAVAVHLTLSSTANQSDSLRLFLEQLTWQWVQGGNTVSLTPLVSGRNTVRTLAQGLAGGEKALQLSDTSQLNSGDLLLILDADSETVVIESQPQPGVNSVNLAQAVAYPHAAGTELLLTTVRFTDVAGPDLSVIKGVSKDISVEAGIESRFLQALLTPPLPDLPSDKYIGIQNAIAEVSADSLLPDFTFSNQAPQDITRNFFPFGQSPKPGDTLYIASDEAFSKPGVNVTLTTHVVSSDSPQLVWEYTIDGLNWLPLPPNSINDETLSLLKGGTISIMLPSAAPAVGQSIVRTRLISGNYQSAPSITLFQLVTQTTLSSPAKTTDTSISVMQKNFAGPGQVLLIEDGINSEILQISSVDATTLYLGSALLHGYDNATASVTVSVLDFYSGGFVASLAAAVTGATTLSVNAYLTISTGDVLRIDDGANTEFIVVTNYSPAKAGGGPGTITCAPALLSGHAQGVYLIGPLQPQANPSLNFYGIADSTWIDLNQYQTEQPTAAFPALGTNPSTSDTFLFGTYIGYVSYAAAAQGAAAAAVTSQLTAAVPAARVQEKAIGSAPIRKPTGGFTDTLPFLSNFRPQIFLNINVDVVPQLPTVDLAWESLSATGWAPLTLIPDEDKTNLFRVGTAPGVKQTITLPPFSCVLAEVNGTKSFWIRVRIVDGNYGLPQQYIPVDPSNPQKGYQVKPGTGNLKPPELTFLNISYDAERNPEALITQNGFLYSDKSQVTSAFVPFVAATDLPTPYADPEPAFYLGFDTVFPQQPVKLWIETATRVFSGSVIYDTSVAPGLLPQLPSLRWEYFNGTTWSRLAVLDGTNNFTESGSIDFLTPADFAPLAKFDLSPFYWIRARSSYNFPPDSQRLDGVYLNAVPAIQAVTISGEIFCSSNAQANQTFTLRNTPVLSGQAVWVMEPESPSDAEFAVIQSEEGPDAVQTRQSSITGAKETWVRWHEVAGFLTSDKQSRHYTLDHTGGLITFGDGQYGMIPLSGLNNLSADYRSGGGAAGNLPAGAVSQVKSALPGVTSVLNPVAADGGADTEAPPAVLSRGPQTLRNRGCAMSAGDMEWLAMEADGTCVARAKCLPNVNSDLEFEPGWVTLLIVPKGTDPKLVPGSEMVRQIESYLVDRAFVGLAQETPARINVIGAGYIEVTVVAEVVPSNPDEAQSVKENVLNTLNAFFHPLTGGSQGTGWEFGRGVYASEVSKLVQSLAGVDHLRSLDLVPNIAQVLVCIPAANRAVAGLPASGSLMTVTRNKASLIAGSYNPDVGGIPIKGLKEGDHISRARDLKVVSAVENILTVSPLDATQPASDAVGFPRGSLVMTFDGKESVQLASAVLPGETVSTITLESPFPDGTEFDAITLFYPFSMTAMGVTVGSISVTVISVSGSVVTVGPFSTGDAGLPVGTAVTTAGGTRMTHLVGSPGTELEYAR